MSEIIIDENSTEIKIDHHNRPTPEVEKRLEEESAAALPQKDSVSVDLKPDEEVVISTKKANTLTVVIVVALFLIALAVVGAVLAARYFGK